MDPTQFALWRFRNAEGVMANITSWNSNECILNINGKIIKITYDAQAELATIIQPDDVFKLPTVVPFKNFVSTLKTLGYYSERPAKERHSLSYKENSN